MATRDQLANVIEKARDEAGRAGMYWAFHAADAVLVALGEELEPEVVWMEQRHAQLKALCKMLTDDGHMTPIATRQILSVFVKRSAS